MCIASIYGSIIPPAWSSDSVLCMFLIASMVHSLNELLVPERKVHVVWSETGTDQEERLDP
jgi:hypothetical protein